MGTTTNRNHIEIEEKKEKGCGWEKKKEDWENIQKKGSNWPNFSLSVFLSGTSVTCDNVC